MKPKRNGKIFDVQMSQVSKIHKISLPYLPSSSTTGKMVSSLLPYTVHSPIFAFSDSPTLSSLSKTLAPQSHTSLLRNISSRFSFSSSHRQSNRVLGVHQERENRVSQRGHSSICFFSADDSNFQNKETGLDWPIFRRWDVPWTWQSISLTSLACGLSFVLTGLTEAAAIPYLGIQIGELGLDEKAEFLFASQGLTTAVVLGVLYGLTNSFGPLPNDVFRYDLREPFNLQKGWLLWAGAGLVGALLAIALTGAAMSFFSGETPQRETDALVRLLPLIGSSTISTASLLAITGVLAPILEETVFRGFFMVSLTKWVPTPVAIVISAAVFALAHLTPGEFPQLFVLGTALGLSYAQTRNLMTPITIHAFWNSGVILLLTFLQLQGYDIKELIQAQ